MHFCPRAGCPYLRVLACLAEGLGIRATAGVFREQAVIRCRLSRRLLCG